MEANCAPALGHPAKRTVAIIGGGPSGLVTARHALHAGLIPTVFEKTSSIGGVFRALNASEPGLAWPSMTTNMSQLTMKFLDFEPKRSPNYPHSTQPEMIAYLHDYVQHFGLQSHIKLEHPVTSVRLIDIGGSKKWKVETSGADVSQGTFDFLVIATGKNAAMNRPNFKNMNCFQGALLDSGRFSTLDLQKEFGGKDVVVIGGSISSADMTALIARFANTVTHVMRRYAYWCPKLLPNNLLDPAKAVRKVPMELVLFARHYHPPGVMEVKFLTPEIIKMQHEFFGSFCKPQFDHPAFAESKVNKSEPPLLWVTGEYQNALVRDPVTKDKIKPLVGETVREFTPSSVLLDSGLEVKADTVLLCTGYKMRLSFLEKSVLDTLEYEEDDIFQELILYKHVLRPEFPTLAFVGFLNNTIWPLVELQARLAVMMFTGDAAYPDAAKMQAGLEDERKFRNLRPRKQFAHDDFIGYADSLAEDMGVLPDFEKLKTEDPDLYQKLWFGPMLPEHYVLHGPGSEFRAAAARRTIDDVWKYINTPE